MILLFILRLNASFSFVVRLEFYSFSIDLDAKNQSARQTKELSTSAHRSF